MKESYKKKLEDMTYYELLRMVCGTDKAYKEARRRLDPLNKKISDKLKEDHL